MKRLEEIDIQNKRVVLRCDFNVPIKDGKITDISKIKKSLETINYLLDKNCLVIMLSHLGRVKSLTDKKDNSLRPVAATLANLINKPVKFINNCYGFEVKNFVANCQLGELVILENTRWMDYPDKLESNNNATLAKFWASLGDIYVNDAFGSCHRAHASTAGIAKFIPSAIGLLVEKELDNLQVLLNNPPKPFTVFMGGAKVDDKLPIIESLLPKCDYLLLGGGIANSFLKANKQDIGNSLATDNEEILNTLKTLLTNYAEKIILPEDFVKNDNIIYDLGEKTLTKYQTYIDKSQIIFVNGTPGKFEEEKYQSGTKNLFKILASSEKKVIIGGGDTVSAVEKFGFEDSFSFLSTGGGATLEYIAKGKLDALEWME